MQRPKISTEINRSMILASIDLLVCQNATTVTKHHFMRWRI
nr:MAG TPA: hypothetical protein [Caudoviricetes sp.]